MKTTRIAITSVIAAALAAASFASVAAAHPVSPSPFNANNGYGQEKQGFAQDGENAGSDKGKGVPQGGPGAGMAGSASKQNSTGLR
jgi:opacity protein-like surface antigen